jgi:hypothetical protein
MAKLARRDLAAEVTRHSGGTPKERIELALRLSREALELFRATLPAGTSAAAAQDILRRNKISGRRRCRLMETPRA